MDTFNWTPEWSLRCTHKPAVLQMKFGNGYSQRAQDGINNDPRVFMLVFQSRSDTEAQAIEDFLSSHGGWQAFYWSPVPNQAQATFICQNFQRIPTAHNLNTVNATFEEEFEP